MAADGTRLFNRLIVRGFDCFAGLRHAPREMFRSFVYPVNGGRF